MAATRLFEFYRRYAPRVSIVGRHQRGHVDEPAAPPVIPAPVKEEYIHIATPRTFQLLGSLPTEIVDEIFSYLEEKDWHVLRRAHRVFKSSAQAAIFRRMTLCNFRGTREPSGVERLISLLKKDERLKNYVCEVKLSSLLDPTVSQEIERLLPEVLLLLRPRKLTIAFRELKGATRDTQENCMRILQKAFKDIPIPPLTIEHDGPYATIMNGLNQFAIDTVHLTGEPYMYPGPHATFNQPWLDSLNLPSLRRLDLGDWHVIPDNLVSLFDSLTNLTAFSMMVNRIATRTAILGLLRSKADTLRELQLRRHPFCRQNLALPALLDLSDFEVLGKLVIDASFLFGAAYCSPYGQSLDEGRNPYVQELIARTEAVDLLPPYLNDLTITFNRPQAVFSRAEHSLQSRSPHVPTGAHGLEFDWMLETVRRQRLLRIFELIEGRHICEHTPSQGNPLPVVDECKLVKFTMPDVMKELFTDLGCQMKVWVQYKVLSALK